MRWLLLALLITPAAAEVTTLRGLERGEIVRETDLEGPADEVDAIAGRVLRRPVQRGRVVRRYDVEEAMDVVRQQGVIIQFIRGPLALRTEGRAMQSGSIGDRINVAVKGRRETMSARIVAPGIVEVGT